MFLLLLLLLLGSGDCAPISLINRGSRPLFGRPKIFTKLPPPPGKMVEQKWCTGLGWVVVPISFHPLSAVPRGRELIPFSLVRCECARNRLCVCVCCRSSLRLYVVLCARRYFVVWGEIPLPPTRNHNIPHCPLTQFKRTQRGPVRAGSSLAKPVRETWGAAMVEQPNHPSFGRGSVVCWLAWAEPVGTGTFIHQTDTTGVAAA